MNFYNPYYMPYMVPRSSGGILSRLFGNGISFNSILNGTQKTLNIINQAIPVVKQVTPMFRNAKTIFNVMNEFRKVDEPIKNEKTKIIDDNDGMPTFFK